MAVILTVDVATWHRQLDETAARLSDGCRLLPVTKGNGYGFGRARLVAAATRLGCSDVAVGTIHELDAVVGTDIRAIVLTPIVGVLDAARLVATPNTVPTVGSRHHVDVLHDAGWRGPVVVKLASSMRRYGIEPDGPDGLANLVDTIISHGWRVEAYALHLPLPAANAGTATNLAEARGWLARLPHDAAVHLSHLAPNDLAVLAGERPDLGLWWRAGTALWHGAAKAGLHLGADVIDVRPTSARQTAGYRATVVPIDGHLVMIGAGTANGVHPLADGRSPFHFAHRRLALLEPPHMHTSMVVVPRGEPCPAVGDLVDVQRPLTQTWVDRVVER